MVLWHPDGVETEFLSQERFLQHLAEKLLRVPSAGPIRWGVSVRVK